MENAAPQLSRILSLPTVLGLLLLTAMWGCLEPMNPKTSKPGGPPPSSSETLKSGEISIGIDVTMEPVLHQLVDGFEQDNPKAKLNTRYQPEADLVSAFLADSLRMIIISRELRPGELAPMRNENLRPTATLIGRDAVVAVIHPENLHDSLKMEQLGRLMRGEAKTWRDIGGNNDEPVILVFDAPKSSTVRMVQEQFMKLGQQLPPNAYQTNDQDKVIDYVAQNKHAIGFIGYSFVADRDDPKVQARLEKVTLARLDATDTSDVGGYFIRPYQNEIALGRYPLTRPIYAVSRERFQGLGTGFVVYAAGELGQRIFLKAGLVPEFMPPRLVVLPEKETQD